MGYLLKRLYVSLSSATVIIEGAMHWHNFLVNYRESMVLDKNLDRHIEREIFHNELLDNGIVPLVVGEECRGGAGRPLNVEREWKLKGILRRDLLKSSLMDHDLHLPRKEDWVVDNHCHVIRSSNE